MCAWATTGGEAVQWPLGASGPRLYIASGGAGRQDRSRPANCHTHRRAPPNWMIVMLTCASTAACAKIWPTHTHTTARGHQACRWRRCQPFSATATSIIERWFRHDALARRAAWRGSRCFVGVKWRQSAPTTTIGPRSPERQIDEGAREPLASRRASARLAADCAPPAGQHADRRAYNCPNKLSTF